MAYPSCYDGPQIMKIYNSFSKETGLEWTPASNDATTGTPKIRIPNAAILPRMMTRFTSSTEGLEMDSGPHRCTTPAPLGPLPGNQNQPKPTKIHFLNPVGFGWFKLVLVGLGYQLAKKAEKTPSFSTPTGRFSQPKPTNLRSMSENIIIDTEAPIARACSPIQLRPIP